MSPPSDSVHWVMSAVPRPQHTVQVVSHPRPRHPHRTHPAASPSTRRDAPTAQSPAGLAAPYPVRQPRTARASLSGGVGSGGGAATFEVPSASVPRVYAALVPAATIAPATSTKFGGQHNENEAAVSHMFVSPTAQAIPLPFMSSAEEHELARWTSDASTMRDAAITASLAGHDTAVISTVPNSAYTAVLHRWWRERLSLRLRQRHSVVLWRALSPILESAVRGTLTAEEAYWQQQQQRTAMLAGGVISNAPSYKLVPAEKMEALMRAVQLVLHQTTAGFAEAQLSLMEEPPAPPTASTLESQEPSGEKATSARKDTHEEGEEEEGLSTEERKALLHAALSAKRLLVQKTRTALSFLAVPSVMALPPKAPVPPPVLRMETAVATTLLERILKQAAMQTPGVAFAMHLVHRNLFPHVYRDCPAWRAVRPQMAGLSEQVTHLATLALHWEGQQSVAVAAWQARGDTRYLEAVVRGWTMRAWLRYVASERQRVAHCAAVAQAFARLHRRLRLQRAVAKWQRRTQNQQRRRQETNMEAAYGAFLTLSKAMEGMGGVPAALAAGAPLIAVAMANASATATATAATSRSATTTNTATTIPSGRHLTSSILSPPTPQPLLVRQSSMNSRKRCAGHSRVYLSFMRQRNSEADTVAPVNARDSTIATTATTLSGGRRGGDGVERFVVRNSDSDADDGWGGDGDDHNTHQIDSRPQRSGEGGVAASTTSRKSVGAPRSFTRPRRK